MKTNEKWVSATLLRRYKRFLADVEMADGSVLTVHTPNTGAMTGCAEPGSRVWLRDVNNPKRKYRYSWEITEDHEGVLVGVNPILANRLVGEGIQSGLIAELQGYANLCSEVKYGQNSRIDWLLSAHSELPDCYVEVKSVTTCDEQGLGYFPDAVSLRATRHLEELGAMVEAGYRAVMLFCVQRNDVRGVRPADEIDPAYGQALRHAMERGVEALAYRAELAPGNIRLVERVSVLTNL